MIIGVTSLDTFLFNYYCYITFFLKRLRNGFVRILKRTENVSQYFVSGISYRKISLMH